MGLGRHLVRELDLEDGVDTLAKWMAHHVAELIEEAETASSAEKRTKASKRATETILKIWESRESLPSYAYPLARYNEVLRVLDRFQRDENPFRNYGQDMGTKTDQLAAILFDNLTRLVMALLLPKLKPIPDAETLGDDAFEALSVEEQRVWKSFLQWNELFAPSQTRSKKGRQSKKREEAPEIDFDKIAIQLVDALTNTLKDLRNELHSHPEGKRSLREALQI